MSERFILVRDVQDGRLVLINVAKIHFIQPSNKPGSPAHSVIAHDMANLWVTCDFGVLIEELAGHGAYAKDTYPAVHLG